MNAKGIRIMDMKNYKNKFNKQKEKNFLKS